MYTKDIKPNISALDYSIIKPLVPYELLPSLVTTNFIFFARQYFTMTIIASWLGVSVRHLYRLLNKTVDTSKDKKLIILLRHILLSNDYNTFIKNCFIDKIIVRSNDNEK